MCAFNKIEPWYEPCNKIFDMKSVKAEMMRSELAFICGIIRALNPQKILEVGVAEGGTTCVILKCLAMMHSTAEVYSIDLRDRLYYDDSIPVGYEYEELKDLIGFQGSHTLQCGKTVAGRIEEIGSGVDLVILDTAHYLPGEVLDFLAVFPYCSKNAMIVLHDVNWPYRGAAFNEKEVVETCKEQIATKVLFSVVSAKKYINWLNANISAFQINENTKDSLNDLFYSLTLPWHYLDEKTLEEYRDLFLKQYEEDQIEIFDAAVESNKMIKERLEMSRGDSDVLPNVSIRLPIEKLPKGSRLVLYGAGAFGKKVYALLKNDPQYDVVGWTATKWTKYGLGSALEAPEDVLCREYDYVIIAVQHQETFDEIKQHILKTMEIPETKFIGPKGYCASNVREAVGL